MSPPRALHASAAGARDGATRLAHDSHDANRLVGPRTEDDDAPGSDRARRGHPPRARMDTPFVGSRAPALDVPRAPHPSSASLTTTDNTRSGNRGDRGGRGDAPLPLGRGAHARGGARRRQDSAFPHAARGFFRDAANVSGDEDDETQVGAFSSADANGPPVRSLDRRGDFSAVRAGARAPERGAPFVTPPRRRSSARRSALLRTNVLFAPETKTPRWKRSVLFFFEGSLGASFMTAVALWSLFGDDARLATFHKEDDVAFVVVTYACLALFTLEMCALCVAKEGYAFGFYFWLDLVATASLLLDVPDFMEKSGLRSPELCDFVEIVSGGGDVLAAPDFFADDDGETVDGAFLRAARASRAGTRAGRIVRVVRLARVLRLCRLWQARAAATANVGRESATEASKPQNVREKTKQSEMVDRKPLATLSEHAELDEVPDASVAIVQTVDAFGTTKARGDVVDVVVVKDEESSSRLDARGEKKNAPAPELAAKHLQTKSSGETRVGQRLSELTTRRVIVGVLGMLFALPWFDLDTYPSLQEASFKESGLRVLHAFAAGPPSSARDGSSETRSYHPPGFYGAVDQYWRAADGLYALVVYGESLDVHVNTSFALPGADFGSRLRCEEFRLAAYVDQNSGSEIGSSPSYAFFDARVSTRTQAALNMCRTVFVCVMLGAGALFFSRDAHALVLKPIERMVKKVREVSENPLKRFAVDEKSDSEDEPAEDEPLEKRADGFLRGGEEKNSRAFGFFSRAARRRRKRDAKRASRTRDDSQMETRLLENSIAKICGLLAVGFGEAGSEIIAANIRRGGEIDPMIPGKKVVAIFGFCDIRQFTDTTEVLQEGVMEFVNTIGKIVHMETHLHGGSANKNVGDAFLLVWKFPEDVTLEDVERPERAPPARRAAVAKVCEGALASFVAIIAGLRRSAKLNAYSNDARLAARMPDFEVKMGFGLHVGWAIEGAIGSEYKVDASYLSPNVNLSARLEAATKQFDVPILISERFVNACGTRVANKCRQIDRVVVKGSEEPMGVFTFDVAHDAAPAPDATEDPLFRRNGNGDQRNGFSESLETSHAAQSHSFFKYDDEFAEHPDLVAMRRGVTEEFLEKFKDAFALYERGRWAEAAEALRPAAAGAWRRDGKGRPVEDGPAKALLRHMEACAFQAPADWRGFRALTEK